MANIAAVCARIPKVDLHLHLDGSLSEEFLSKRAELDGRPLPCELGSLREYLLCTKTVSPNQEAGGNWPAFDICNEYLQTSDGLRGAVLDLLRRHHEIHNVRVIEIRFCAALHTKCGLSEDDVVRVVSDAYGEYASARRDTLRGGIILCALRSFGGAHISSTMALSEKWYGRFRAGAGGGAGESWVIGADLAGDEGTFPLCDALTSPLLAASSSVPLTLHAGEWSVGEASAAVSCGARRLGHGLTVVRDSELMSRMRRDGVSIEVCMTSNVSRPEKTGVESLRKHPIREMLQNGLTVAGLNCDNTMLSGTLDLRPDPTKEVQRAVEVVGLSWEQVRNVLLDGVRASFAMDFRKKEDREFMQRFEKELDMELHNGLVL